jgi:hypothetical protein
VLGDGADQLGAVAVGQAHVGQAEIEMFVLDQVHGIRQRCRAACADTQARAGDGDQFEDVCLVVDDQRSCIAHGGDSPLG